MARKENKKVLDFAKSKKDRYLSSRIKRTLDNISFFDYKTNLVTKIQTEYNFDKAIEIIKKDKGFSIRLSDDEMKAFAHVLFNKGYLTGENNCWGACISVCQQGKRRQIKSYTQQVVWQYGEVTNIFPIFCSLVGLQFLPMNNTRLTIFK